MPHRYRERKEQRKSRRGEPQKVSWEKENSFDNFEAADSLRKQLKEGHGDDYLVKVHLQGQGKKTFVVKVGKPLKQKENAQ